jgi:hypothetical protein
VCKPPHTLVSVCSDSLHLSSTPTSSRHVNPSRKGSALSEKNDSDEGELWSAFEEADDIGKTTPKER